MIKIGRIKVDVQLNVETTEADQKKISEAVHAKVKELSDGNGDSIKVVVYDGYRTTVTTNTNENPSPQNSNGVDMCAESPKEKPEVETSNNAGGGVFIDEQYREIIRKLDIEVAELKKENDELEYRLEESAYIERDLRKDIAILDFDNQDLKNGNKKLQRTIDGLKEDVEWLSQKCLGKDKYIEKLREEVDDLMNEKANLDATANGLMSRCERKDKEIARLEKKAADLDGRVKGYSNRLRELENENAELKTESGRVPTINPAETLRRKVHTKFC